MTEPDVRMYGNPELFKGSGTDDPQERARQALPFAVSGQATDSKKADILWEAMRGLEGAETGFLFRQLYDEWLRRRY